MATIGIVVNGDELQMADNSCLTHVMERLHLPQKRIAVELNGKVVSRSEWPQTKLTSGDKIEVVHFVGGG